MKPIYLLLILTMATLGCIDEPIEVHITEQVPTQKVIVKISNFSLDGRFFCGNVSEWGAHKLSGLIYSTDYTVRSYVERGEIIKAITISHPKIKVDFWYVDALRDSLFEDDYCIVDFAPDFKYHISISIDGTEIYDTNKQFRSSYGSAFLRCFDQEYYYEEPDEFCIRDWVDAQVTPEFWINLYKDV